MICQNCGAEVSDTAKFCRKCGAKMAPAEESVENSKDSFEEAVTEPAAESFEAAASQNADGDILQGGTTQEDVLMGDNLQDDMLQEDAPGADTSQEEDLTDHQTASDQPFGMGAGTAEFVGKDYQWGPPTGGENYDEPAMPAVFVRDADEAPKEKPEAEQESAYTYRIEGPDYDHTDEFEPEDISRNKIMALAAYLLGPLGVIIALLAGKDSPYADFHMRQGLKFVIVESILTILAMLLCWTLIVPAAAAVLMVILWVIKIITIISVCKGRAVEAAIIRSLGFLK